MELFDEMIVLEDNLYALMHLKTEIKNRVIAPHLNWSERAELYSMVQLINERIHFIEKNVGHI